MKKDAPFAWSAACAEAFQGLKYALTHAPVLVLPDFSTDAPTFEVWCDASGFAVGAVLMQGGRPVAFEARTMTPAERNYTVGEHELLAVVYALTKWRCYLEGVTFRVMTDHAPNTFMPTKAQLSRRQARWSEFLQRFHLSWHYKPGSLNVADPVSRTPNLMSLASMLCSRGPDTACAGLHPEETSSARPKAPRALLNGTLEAMPHCDVASPPSAGVDNPVSLAPCSLATCARPLVEAELFNLLASHHVLLGAMAAASDRGVVPEASVDTPASPQVASPPIESTLSDLLSRIIDGYDADPLFASTPAVQHAYARNPAVFTHKGLWVTNSGAVVVPNDPALRRDIVFQAHNTATCGHGGYHATLNRLKPCYYWAHGGMPFAKFVESYVRNCVSCQMNKSSSRKPAGLLQPLQPAAAPWLSISIDFITGLPVSSLGNDCVLVCVDRFTKGVHLAACKKTITAKEFALLLFQTVYRLHGIPQDIVSDRGTLFTSHFWKELSRLLGTKLRMSTAYHPETDGQTERANRVLQEVLRHVVDPSQLDWDVMLAGAELAMNTYVRKSTGETPFMLTHGREALLPFNMHLLPNLMAALTDEELESAASADQCSLTMPMTPADESKVPAARRLYGRMSDMHARTRAALAVASQRQKQFADAGRRELEFAVGDQVLLSSKHIKLKVPRGGKAKLMPKYIGPFEVTERLGAVAYRLKLPKNLPVHPVFHVSLLNEYRSDGSCQPPLSPESFELEGEAHWNVDKIMSHEWRLTGRWPKLYYLVHWDGFSHENDTSEPAENLFHASGPVKAYRARVLAAGGTLDPPVRTSKPVRLPPPPPLPLPPPTPQTVTRYGRRVAKPTGILNTAVLLWH